MNGNNIHIAGDTANNRIGVVYTNGTINTFAGNGALGYSGDGGPATSAELNQPSGVAISSAGEIYIADWNNNRIRVVYTNGTITTFAGNGIRGYSGDGGPATSAELNQPSGVAISSAGEIYIADRNNNVIRKTSCKPGYTGQNCIFPVCFGVNSFSSDVCSGNGTCMSPNKCICNSSYTGYNCELSVCYGINQTSSNVCSGTGNCIGPNKCNCFSGYFGNECELYKCFEIENNKKEVCSGNGICLSPNKCKCKQSFVGSNCRFNLRNLAYLTLILLILIAVLLVLMIWLFKRGYVDVKRRKKQENALYQKLLEYEMSEKDGDDSSYSNLKMKLDELKFTEKISEGAGGVVYKGLWYQKIVAIKKLKVTDEDAFIREISILNRLRHPNVLELYGYSIDSKGYHYIVTEFMDKGSLVHLLYNNKLRSFETKIKSLLDIANGMKFLHERSIMHRDLKPQNLLANKDNICKICDFGLAKVMNETLTLGMIGTWQYMAPEIMNESGKYNEKCDVYSFGIMIHEIFTLTKPYATSASEYVNQFTIGLKILNGLRPNIPSVLFNSEISDEILSNMMNYFLKSNELPNSITKTNDEVLKITKMYFELCAACWTSNSSDRPTFDQIIFKLQEIEKILSDSVAV